MIWMDLTRIVESEVVGQLNLVEVDVPIQVGWTSWLWRACCYILIKPTCGIVVDGSKSFQYWRATSIDKCYPMIYDGRIALTKE